MYVFVDESGDLGWTLDKPYRRGGSSQYLTIAHVIIPKTFKHVPKRLVRDLYTSMAWPTTTELKASNLKPKHRVYFANKVAAMLASNPEIKIAAITVKKQNVVGRLRRDENILYNYMIKISLLDHIKTYGTVHFMIDKRSIKVKSGNSLFDYLQTILATEFDSDTVLSNHSLESQNSLNIQFADYIANFIWRGFESKDKDALNIVAPYIINKTLFF